MTASLLERYGGPVPRYTSYPTAPHFDETIGPDDYGAWLETIGADDALSLYLHVPFCAEMCWYCGCHTKVVRRYDPVRDYAALLREEAAIVGALIPSGPRVRHVHWGGGTPNMLSPDDFEALTEVLRRRFDFAENVEMAVEIDPRTAGADHAAAFARAGVTRVSFGVQDFNPHVQRAINRFQPFEQTAEVIERFRTHGIDEINLDLMYGLPHQTVADVIRTVDLTAELRPDRLALFGYAHVPWMKSHQRMIDEAALPDAAARMAQATAAADRLERHGYRRIGLDHFCHPDDPLAQAIDEGRLHRNFQGYTTDAADALLGFGASAIGQLKQGYIQNHAPLNRYADAIGEGRAAICRGYRLDAEDRLRAAVIEQLMCNLTIDVAAAAATHGAPADHFDAEMHMLAPMQRDGLIELNGSRLRITETGRPYLRTVCAAFDAYLRRGTAQHSIAV
jgi:oxygen-independent coproporphyrinogen-3 oxidase